MIPVLAFLFGLLIGSFLNVCIYRMPKEESIVQPRSRCPHCGSPIRWYDNVPVLSFLWLGGRCRDCRAAISFLYPAVELLTGLLFAALAWRFGVTLGGAKYALFVAMMLILGFADLNDRLLPDEITLGGAAVGLVFSVVRPLKPDVMHLALLMAGVSLSPRLTSLVESAVAAAIGSCVLYLVGEAYYRVRFREGMGFGDVKMMALIGSFLGLRQALFTVMLASVLGAVLGLLFIALFRKGLAYELPFGTFLAFASIAMVIWAHETA